MFLRQLKNQLEDSEFAHTAPIKGRQHAKQELVEAQQQLEETLRLHSHAEKYLRSNREKSNYQYRVINETHFISLFYLVYFNWSVERSESTRQQLSSSASTTHVLSCYFIVYIFFFWRRGRHNKALIHRFRQKQFFHETDFIWLKTFSGYGISLL